MDESGFFNLQKSPQGVLSGLHICTCGEKITSRPKHNPQRGGGDKNKFRGCNLYCEKCAAIKPRVHITLFHLRWPLAGIIPVQNKPMFGISIRMQFFLFPVNSAILELTLSHPPPSTPLSSEKHHRNSLGKGLFVQQPPPSSQIDGPCNWQPLCAIARINRHWCRQAKSVSGAQGAADMVELMVRHIYRQNTINVSAERSGRLWVARRVTVLLILWMLLSDGVSMLTYGVRNYGLFEQMGFFFLFLPQFP